MSKGSSPRPYSVDLNTFNNNWDNIFRKDPKVVEDQNNEDEAFDQVVNAYNNERLVSKFDKEQTMTPAVEQMKKGTCGCGRSPTGDCIGWHALSEVEYQAMLETYLAENVKDSNQGG